MTSSFNLWRTFRLKQPDTHHELTSNGKNLKLRQHVIALLDTEAVDKKELTQVKSLTKRRINRTTIRF
jgi:hypothetical protein